MSGINVCFCLRSKSRFVRILTLLIMANTAAALVYLYTISHQAASINQSQTTAASLASKLYKYGSKLMNISHKKEVNLHGNRGHHEDHAQNKDQTSRGHQSHAQNRKAHHQQPHAQIHHSSSHHQVRHSPRDKIHHSPHRKIHHRHHHGKLHYQTHRKNYYPLYVAEDWRNSVMRISQEYHIGERKVIDYASLRPNTSSTVMFSDVAAENPHLLPGGRFKPHGIHPRSKVAIIIPYRRRWYHLRLLLHHLHPILQKQGLQYGVFIVHQRGEGLFNKASLLNVGYLEASKLGDYKCFVFHDVDLIPENHRCLYTCSETTNDPRHIATAVSKFGYNSNPGVTIGGVSAFSRRQLEVVNGWSNQFHGWGGEDDDMAKRIRSKHMHIRRPPRRYCRFTSLPHGRDKGNPYNRNRWKLLRSSKERMSRDGLNTIKYHVASTQKYATYTNISVNLQ